jgi:hypothetical protein
MRGCVGISSKKAINKVIGQLMSEKIYLLGDWMNVIRRDEVKWVQLC